MSVYWLCELAFDTAVGHAVNVSGDTSVYLHYTQSCKMLPIFFAYSFMHLCLCHHRENLLADCLQGCFVVTCTLCAFISLVWLREQIVHGGAPQWLEQHQPPPPNAAGQANEVLQSNMSLGHQLINS